MEMILQKTSEKIIIWMHRTKITQEQIASEIGITRQTFAKKLQDNSFEPKDILTLKRLGFQG